MCCFVTPLWWLHKSTHELKLVQLETKEMTQCVRTCIALAGDPSLVPSTHVGRLTTVSNSSSGGFSALFWTLWAPTFMSHTYTHPSAHTHTFKKIFKIHDIVYTSSQCVCLCTCACAHVCRGHRSMLDVFFNCSLPYYF